MTAYRSRTRARRPRPPRLACAGATFVNAGSYYNQVLTQFPGVPVRVTLPEGTRGVAANLGVFYPIAGTYTVRLSSGAVFTASSSTRPSRTS